MAATNASLLREAESLRHELSVAQVERIDLQGELASATSKLEELQELRAALERACGEASSHNRRLSMQLEDRESELERVRRVITGSHPNLLSD